MKLHSSDSLSFISQSHRPAPAVPRHISMEIYHHHHHHHHHHNYNIWIRPSGLFWFRIWLINLFLDILVGLLGWGISLSRSLYLYRAAEHRKTHTYIHALRGIRSHDSSVQAVEDHTAQPLGLAMMIYMGNILKMMSQLFVSSIIHHSWNTIAIKNMVTWKMNTLLCSSVTASHHHWTSDAVWLSHINGLSQVIQFGHPWRWVKMEAARPLKMVVSYHINTWCHNPKDDMNIWK